MEERKEEGEIQEHGPEHWFSKWERQCLAEAEQSEPNEEESEQSQQKLWHLFQNSATAVAQLYKDRVCQQQGLSLWVPFQNAATAVTNLYKESMEARQRSYDLGIHLGYQRRNKEVIAWVKKRRRTIRREDLISFLCGKVPPQGQVGPHLGLPWFLQADQRPLRQAALWRPTCSPSERPLHYTVLAVPWRAFLCARVLLVPQPILPSPSAGVGTAFMTWTSTPSSLRRWRFIWIPLPIANAALPPVVTSSQTHPLINVTGCSELFLHH
ncbi:unnamed protein product [Pleuronectes platessa]|uniref:Uncharacterized protein n=1 Tax=Pleuronectes platessa TaxID=8262 RepID=A0A9N7Y9D1_PLEPL|nr:unnamed protein product [Pleuronectes platessa]